MYPKFSIKCKGEMISFLRDSSKSKNFIGIKLMVEMPTDGDIGHIKLSPHVQAFLLDKKSLASIFKYTSDKVISVEHNSIYENPKELVKWDGNSIGDKIRDMDDFGDIILIFMWLFVMLGSYSILGILVSLSVLFHVVKKFKYINTNYGPYMKHVL
jgi:hypothetical protein